MKTNIEWNGQLVQIDTEDRLIILKEIGNASAALMYIPGVPCHILINLEGPHPVWVWNGDKRNPSISPSILTRLNWGADGKEICNHVFVREGKIQYLGDCTHEYAGMTLELPKLCDWPDEFILWT